MPRWNSPSVSSFFIAKYSNLKTPDFYKPEREYLVDLCGDLQDFYEGDEEVLVINEPPRHGKSGTAVLCVEWVLEKNKEEKIMTGSYNKTLSTMFSKNVRDSIQEIKADAFKPVYSDVFPNVRIKQGDGAMNLWSLFNRFPWLLNKKDKLQVLTLLL